MIPADNVVDDFKIEPQPSKSWRIDLNNKSVSGLVDGLEEVKQTIFKILNTERYKYLIYSWNYGVELEDLYGKHVSYVCAELKRRITEALVQDDRIESVDSFVFDTSKKRTVTVKFTVHTILGDTQAEKAVTY